MCTINNRISYFTIFIMLSSYLLCSVSLTPSVLDTSANMQAPIINDEIIYIYNTSDTRQEFILKNKSLDLGRFNNLSLVFEISGEKTDVNGIEVSFIINSTKIDFILAKHYQNSGVQVLSQAFEYPNEFTGSMNITIVCKAKVFSGGSGTLRIINSTLIEKLAIPEIQSNPKIIPVYPNWLIFDGYAFGERNRTVKTAFLNTKENQSLNLSVFFVFNDIQTVSKKIILEINSEIVDIREIKVGTNLLIFQNLKIEQGFNLIQCYFSFQYCNSLIEIKDINFLGNSYSFLDFLPLNSYDWIYWRGDGINHSIDLSALKPQSTERSLKIWFYLDFGCLGTIISPSIHYEIHDGYVKLCEGYISEQSQKQSFSQIIEQTWTSFHDTQLKICLYGSTEGEVVFYLLNTSRIEIESIPEITTETYETILIEEEEIRTPQLSYFEISICERFFFNNSETMQYSFFLLFDFIRKDHEGISYIKVEVYEGNFLLIEETVDKQGKTNLTALFSAKKVNSLVNITLSIFGAGNTIIIRNMYIQIKLFVEEQNTNNEDDSNTNFLRDKWILQGILLLYQASMLSILVLQELRRRSKYVHELGVKELIINILHSKKYKKKQLLSLTLKIISFIIPFAITFFLLKEFNYLTSSLSQIICSIVCGSIFFALMDLLMYRIGKKSRSLLSKGATVRKKKTALNVYEKIRNWLAISKKRRQRIILIVGVLTHLISINFIMSFLLNHSILGDYYFHVECIDCIAWGMNLSILGIFLSIFPCFFIIKLGFNMISFEDNIIKSLLLGLLVLSTLFFSWGVFLYFIIINKSYLDSNIYSILWTLAMPVGFAFLLGIVYRLGKSKAKELNITFLSLLKCGKFTVNQEEITQAFQNGNSSRMDYQKVQDDVHREVLYHSIQKNLVLNSSISFKGLSRIANVPESKIEGLLTDILDEILNMGTIAIANKTFTLKKIGSDNIFSINGGLDKRDVANCNKKHTSIDLGPIKFEEIGGKQNLVALFKNIDIKFNDEKVALRAYSMLGHIFDGYVHQYKEGNYLLSLLNSFSTKIGNKIKNQSINESNLCLLSEGEYNRILSDFGRQINLRYAKGRRFKSWIHGLVGSLMTRFFERMTLSMDEKKESLIEPFNEITNKDTTIHLDLDIGPNHRSLDILGKTESGGYIFGENKYTQGSLISALSNATKVHKGSDLLANHNQRVDYVTTTENQGFDLYVRWGDFILDLKEELYVLNNRYKTWPKNNKNNKIIQNQLRVLRECMSIGGMTEIVKLMQIEMVEQFGKCVNFELFDITKLACYKLEKIQIPENIKQFFIPETTSILLPYIKVENLKIPFIPIKESLDYKREGGRGSYYTYLIFGFLDNEKKEKERYTKFGYQLLTPDKFEKYNFGLELIEGLPLDQGTVNCKVFTVKRGKTKSVSIRKLRNEKIAITLPINGKMVTIDDLRFKNIISEKRRRRISNRRFLRKLISSNDNFRKTEIEEEIEQYFEKGIIREFNVTMIDSLTWEALGYLLPKTIDEINSKVPAADIAFYLRLKGNFEYCKQDIIVSFKSRNLNLTHVSDPSKPLPKLYKLGVADIIRADVERQIISQNDYTVDDVLKNIEKSCKDYNYESELLRKFVSPFMLIELMKSECFEQHSNELYYNFRKYFDAHKEIKLVKDPLDEDKIIDPRISISSARNLLFDFFKFQEFRSINQNCADNEKIDSITYNKIINNKIKNYEIQRLRSLLVFMEDNNKKPICKITPFWAVISEKVIPKTLKRYILCNGKIIPVKYRTNFGGNSIYPMISSRFTSIRTISSGKKENRYLFMQSVLGVLAGLSFQPKTKKRKLSAKTSFEIGNIMKDSYKNLLFPTNNKNNNLRASRIAVNELRTFRKQLREGVQEHQNSSYKRYGEKVVGAFISRAKDFKTNKGILKRDILVIRLYINGYSRIHFGGKDVEVLKPSYSLFSIQKSSGLGDMEGIETVLSLNKLQFLELKSKLEGKIPWSKEDKGITEQELCKTSFMKDLFIAYERFRFTRKLKKDGSKGTDVFHVTDTEHKHGMKKEYSKRNRRLFIRNSYMASYNHDELKKFISKYIEFLGNHKSTEHLTEISVKLLVDKIDKDGHRTVSSIGRALQKTKILNLKTGETSSVLGYNIEYLWQELEEILRLKEKLISFYDAGVISHTVSRDSKIKFYSRKLRELNPEYSIFESIIYNDEEYNFSPDSYAWFDNKSGQVISLETVLLKGIRKGYIDKQQKLVKIFDLLQVFQNELVKVTTDKQGRIHGKTKGWTKLNSELS